MILLPLIALLATATPGTGPPPPGAEPRAARDSLGTLTGFTGFS